MIDREKVRRIASPSTLSQRFALSVGSAIAVGGCGGGFAMLHPARTLEEGQLRASAGLSANLALGEHSSALANARAQAGSPRAPSGVVGADETYAKGALVAASVGPGLAPFVAARVGLGRHFEGGLAYTGRAVRADARRSFDLSEHWALSVGAGGSATLYGRQGGEVLQDVELSQLHGWGADVPVLIGYASDGDLYTVWLGARAGWEHVDISDVRSVPSAAPLRMQPNSLSATRVWAGGLLGLAVGFRHVHVSMEIDISHAAVSGAYSGTHAQVAGLTVAPATALWWRF